MSKEFSKEEWHEYRNEIFELVMLYQQVKEYANFEQDKIENIKSFFFLSKRNAITAFFIKVGFILTEGITTLKDFIDNERYDYVSKLYRNKLGLVRNKIYAHNAKADKKLKGLTLLNEDVDEVYFEILKLSEEVDLKFKEKYNYDIVIGADGIKSLEKIIDLSNELIILKKKLMACGYQARVTLNITTGKLHMLD